MKLSPQPLRIGLLMDHPSPHMTPFLDALARLPEAAPVVLYLGEKGPGRQWGNAPGELPCLFAKAVSLGAGPPVHPGLTALLRTVRADIWVINTCYTTPATWRVARWLSREGRPWVYMNEPTRPREGWKDAAKAAVLRRLLRGASGLVGMGRQTAERYRPLLPPGCPVGSTPYYCDLSPFLALPEWQAPDSGEVVRFVAMAQLTHRKGYDLLLQALQPLSGRAWRLDIAGDGPLRASLEAAFGAAWPDGRVRFLGNVPFASRQEVFRAGHCFLFPSRWDGWGMALPEAMAAGLPVIASDGVMSAWEFIAEGQNGFKVVAGDVKALAERLAWCVENNGQLAQMGRAAREAVRHHQPDVGARNWVAFLDRVWRGQPRRAVELAETPTWKGLLREETPGKRLRFAVRQSLRSAWLHRGALGREPAPRGHRILVYHAVLREDRERFAQHLQYLSGHYRLTTVSDLLARLDSAEPGPPLLAISFDDGLRVLWENALDPLTRLAIPGTFYIPTGFASLAGEAAAAAEFARRAFYYHQDLLPMGAEEVRQLAAGGHEIGSHGHSHTAFDALSAPALVRELAHSREVLRAWSGQEVRGLAYPYGRVARFAEGLRPAVVEAGYRHGVTLRRGVVSRGGEALLLPREHVEGYWPLAHLRYFLARAGAEEGGATPLGSG
ncbi:MAG: glycosyltransferase [Magnetococcales bacterium]|nr:glycosyltransferase [Magnetococcales bacterium]